MTPTLKPLTYRDRKFVDALFGCPNRSGPKRKRGHAISNSWFVRAGGAAGTKATDWSRERGRVGLRSGTQI